MFVFSFRTGYNAIVDHLPSIHIIYHVYHWIRVVRIIAEEEVLHAAVFPVCLDARRAAHRGDTELPHHHQHIPRHDMVHRPRLHDRHKRRHGLYVRFLLWQDPLDPAQSQEDLGGIHWGRHLNSLPGHAGTDELCLCTVQSPTKVMSLA